MRIFAEQNLAEFFEQRLRAMLHEIEEESSKLLLSMDESEYVKHLADKYQIQPLTFGFDAIEVTSAERLIPGEAHPRTYTVQPGRSYARPVIVFHVPFSGEVELLRCRPSRRTSWNANVTVVEAEIQFDMVNWNNDPEELKRKKQQMVEDLAEENANVTNDIGEFNARLEEVARRGVSRRKSQLLTQLAITESLGKPRREKAEVRETFAVRIAPKKLVVKPPVGTNALPADPTLANETYEEILTIIYDAGVMMERLPSTYAEKQEEDLRDYLLMVLATHYANTTGETFNKSGKTDILVRHEGANVFVGECKFWKGSKVLYETIDQVLGYLTWRDSKAAIVFFVTSKVLGLVLQDMMDRTVKHRCFLGVLKSNRQESWVEYLFHLPSDPTIKVRLAILSFHFPAG